MRYLRSMICFLFAALLTSVCASGCDAAEYGADYVAAIKGGHLEGYSGVPIGTAFDSFFGSPSWKGFDHASGEIVEFTGDMMYEGRKVTVCVQFLIHGDSSFETVHFSINDAMAPELYDATIAKVYETYIEGFGAATETPAEKGTWERADQQAAAAAPRATLKDTPIVFGIKIGDSDDDVRIKLYSRFQMIKDHRVSAESALKYLGELLSFSDTKDISHIPSAKRDVVTIDAPDGGSSIYSTGIRFNDAMADKGIARINIETQYFNNTLIYLRMFIASADSGNADSQPAPESTAALAIFEHLSAALNAKHKVGPNGEIVWEIDEHTFTLQSGDEWEPPTFTYTDTSKTDHIYYP